MPGLPGTSPSSRGFMFRRSFRSRRRRSFSRYRGRKSLHRTPKRSGRYQRGNFHITSTNFINNSNNTSNIVLVMAKISEIIGDPTTAKGITDEVAMKYLDIGGIRFDYVLQDQTPTSVVQVDSVVRVASAQCVLATDRLDTGGQPEAILANWGRTTHPTITAAAGLATGQYEENFPTRVHWRRMHLMGQQSNTGNTTVTTNSLLSKQVQVRSCEGSANLKLRLRLDDEHALTFHHCLTTDSAFPASGAEIDVKLWLVGSLWYRWSL